MLVELDEIRSSESEVTEVNEVMHHVLTDVEVIEVNDEMLSADSTDYLFLQMNE